MNTYETYQVKMAIKACRGDSILRTICIWCKKALGRYENENGLGFCYVCRRMLFPKSFAHPRIARERRPTTIKRAIPHKGRGGAVPREVGRSTIKVTNLKEGSEAKIPAVEP